MIIIIASFSSVLLNNLKIILLNKIPLNVNSVKTFIFRKREDSCCFFFHKKIKRGGKNEMQIRVYLATANVCNEFGNKRELIKVKQKL